MPVLTSATRYMIWRSPIRDSFNWQQWNISYKYPDATYWTYLRSFGTWDDALAAIGGHR